MSLSFIGALVALLPPALLRPKKSPEIARLREDERRARELSNAYAALAIEKLVSAHWKEEAKRLARSNRVDREHFERLLQEERAHERAHEMSVHMSGAQQLQAQLMNAQAHQQLAQAHQQLAQYDQQARPLQWAGGFEGFCNCVPGRSQVWAAEQHAIAKRNPPDPVGDRIAQLRP